MATNQYEIVIKVDEGTQGGSQFAGNAGASSGGAGGNAGGSGGSAGGQGGAAPAGKGGFQTFAKTVAAAGLVSSAKSVGSYVVNRVETWSGNKALQDQVNLATNLASSAVSLGFAAAAGPLGLAAWGVGKITSFALQAVDFSYNKQMEEYARQMNAERQSEGRYFE